MKNYRIAFEPWGLLLFLLTMVPNLIWSAVPAPNDVLRGASSTGALDAVASVCQVLFAAALCAVVVRRQSPEIALVLGAGACALIVLYCSGALTAVVELADKLAQTGGLSAQVVEPVMKTAGIAIVTRLAADFCKDAQEGGLASAVELAGTVLALSVTMPLMTAVLDVLAQLL